ncbi:kinase-like protein [Trametes punicea]|nr:kinase-like protein [Trametes punicea]
MAGLPRHRVEFHFDTMGTTEELERYSVGGYHPVVVGDTFDSNPTLTSNERRYRVLHKLGYGSYATVWLARDNRSNTFVALKLATADSATEADSREARMLLRLARAADDGHSTHVLTLYDHFTVAGPNGRHPVLVTEVVVPFSAAVRRFASPGWLKAAVRGLALGVAHMHRNGIKHGDLHLGNLGCAMPELATQDEDDVVQDLSTYDVTLVLPCDAAAQTPSLPPYVLPPCDLAKYWERIRSPMNQEPDVKILDFGNARGAVEPPGEIQCAVGACAPEVAFARVALRESRPAWGLPSDVWAVGAMMYEIVSGSSLFYGVGMGDGLLGRMVGLAGWVPKDWQAYWQSRPGLQTTDVSVDAADQEWERRRGVLRKGCTDEADAHRLVALLRKVLVLEPESRPSIEDVLKDPWLQTGTAA